MYQELNIINITKEKNRVGIGSVDDRKCVRWAVMSEMDKVHEVPDCRMVIRRSEAGEKS